MKQNIAKKWAAALRSGKYDQGKCGLRNKDDEYCCLGVLCDISGLAEWEESQFYFSYLGDKGYLPTKVREWAGIKSINGNIYEIRDSLVCLNDRGDTFEEIAKVIEQNWEHI